MRKALQRKQNKEIFEIRRMAAIFQRAQVDKHTAEMATLDNRYVAIKKTNRTEYVKN